MKPLNSAHQNEQFKSLRDLHRGFNQVELSLLGITARAYNFLGGLERSVRSELSGNTTVLTRASLTSVFTSESFWFFCKGNLPTDNPWPTLMAIHKRFKVKCRIPKEHAVSQEHAIQSQMGRITSVQEIHVAFKPLNSARQNKQIKSRRDYHRGFNQVGMS